MKIHRRSVARAARRYLPVVLAAAASPMLDPNALAQTWGGHGTWSFSNPNAWVNGVVPVSSPSTQLFFPNDMSGSYRAFNDLGILTVGAINVASRTPTATFIGQNAGSAIQFADGAQLNSNDSGLFRFGGVSGVTNDMRLQGNLTFGGTGYGQIFVATPVADASGSSGRLTIDAPAANDRDSFLRLEGANTFSGGIDLKRGVLELGNATAAGTGAITANGGVLRSSAAITVGNNITTNSALKLRLNNSATFSGVVSGPGGIDFRSVGDTSASTGSFTNANTYTGATTIDWSDTSGFSEAFAGISAGSVIFAGATGSSLNTSEYNVRNGGVLGFVNTTAVTNRLADDAPVNLTNGRINATSNTTTAATERIGNLTVNGNGIVFFSTGAGGTTLSTPQIIRGDRATMVVALGHANSHLKSDAAPVLVNGIIPWISGANSTITSPRELMTIDVTNGIQPLAAGDYATDFSGGPTSNVKIAASVNNDSVVDINALVVSTGTVNITGTGTIRPGSGAVVLATSGVVSNNIDFGSAEGIIHVGAIAAIDGVISGSNGLTKAGDFALNTAAAHTYTGPTTINAGGFRFTNPDAFNTTSGFVVRSIGGQELVPTLDYRGAGTATINKPAVVESGVMRLANGTPLAPERAMVYSGVISGTGNVFLEQGAITLTAHNTYTGLTRISRAEVELFSDDNFGLGPVLEIAGTIGRGLVLMNDWNTNKLIRVTETSTLDTNGFNATWNHGVEASDALTKVGPGTLRINGYSPSMSTQFWDIGTSTRNGGRVEVDGDARMTLEVNDGVLAARGTFHGVRVFTDKGTLQPGDIGGPGVGSIDAAGLILSLGSTIDFDLGDNSDFLKSHTTLNKASGGAGPVNVAFRVDPSADLGMYTLIEYFENPSASLTFLASDFAFTSNVAGFDGFFGINTLPNGWQAVQFTVTAVPEPTTMLAAASGVSALLVWRGRGRTTRHSRRSRGGSVRPATRSTFS